MMELRDKWIWGCTVVFILIGLSVSIYKSERIIDSGELVLLELAPVDPRSLMQGDYMDLRYRVSDTLYAQSKVEDRGYLILDIDSFGVGRYVGFDVEKPMVRPNQCYLPYRRNSQQFSIGAEHFFFQEGHASYYERAKYGGLRISSDGNSILVGLYDEGLSLIEPKDSTMIR